MKGKETWASLLCKQPRFSVCTGICPEHQFLLFLSCTTCIHYLLSWNPWSWDGIEKFIPHKCRKKELPISAEVLHTQWSTTTDIWIPSKPVYKLQMHRPMPRGGGKRAQHEEKAGFDTAQLMIRFSLQPQHTNTRPLHRWERGAWGPVNREFYQCATITATPVLNNFERWSTVKSQCSVALEISHFLPAVEWSCIWAVAAQNFLNVFLSSPLGCLSHRYRVPKLPPSCLCIFIFISLLLVQWKTLGMEW